ncbi:hypothetical protein AA313_de0210469 [Arthrobotrys entomopaga]|nr:hypothetical protein AA313_de0210469 [Arthrobotrys entomopaga]
MEVISNYLVGCCGCGRGEESDGRLQDQNAVVDRQPKPILPMTAVKVYKTIKRIGKPRYRYPKPTGEQLEAFYQEGKELARLEAEKAKEDTLRDCLTDEDGIEEPHSENPELSLITIKDDDVSIALPPKSPPPSKHIEHRGVYDALSPSDITSAKNPDNDEYLRKDEPTELALPSPLIITKRRDRSNNVLECLPPKISKAAQVVTVNDADVNKENVFPALKQNKQVSTVSVPDQPDFTTIMAEYLGGPDIAGDRPSLELQDPATSKKLALFFQENRSERSVDNGSLYDLYDRSSIYPSNEVSMVYPPSRPLSPRQPSPVPMTVTKINGVRKISRQVSPGNLLIRPIFEVLQEAEEAQVAPTLNGRIPLADKTVTESEQAPLPRPVDDPKSVECSSLLASPLLRSVRSVSGASITSIIGIYVRSESSQEDLNSDVQSFDVRSLPHPDEFELEENSHNYNNNDDINNKRTLPVSIPVDEVDLGSLPHPDDFEDVLYDVPLTPYRSPTPQTTGISSFFLTSSAWLKLEFARVKQFVEDGLMTATPWNKPEPNPEPVVPKTAPVVTTKSTRGDVKPIIIDDGIVASNEQAREVVSNGQRINSADYTDTLSQTYEWEPMSVECVALPTTPMTPTWSGRQIRQLTTTPVPIAQQEAPTFVVLSPAASSAATRQPSLGSPLLQAADSLGMTGPTRLVDPLPRLLSPTGSLVNSSPSEKELVSPDEAQSCQGSRSVSGSSWSSGPRYDIQPHMVARRSTCGLEVTVERGFYKSYEDRAVEPVKSWMRGRRSVQRF